MSEEQKYQLAFNYFQKFGPVKIKLLESYFSNLREAFFASSASLEKAGLDPKIVKKFTDWRKSYSLELSLQEIEKENIKIITWHDVEYPKLLLEIHSPPPILYYRGNINIFNENKNYLAIVGSREHSAYANKIVSEFIPQLTKNELVIVSGLASGVDTLAHQETLANNGITIAVLGCGLNENIIYPYSNRWLAKKIISNNGLLLSEFPPRTGPLKQNFPQRNRIIAGLCQATIVIESRSKSGSLITAYQALDQNRDVLAVPGNIYSEFSQGPNNLIKSGAKTIINFEDILTAYELNTKTIKPSLIKKVFQPELSFETETEKIVYTLIKNASSRGERINTDEIFKNSKLDTTTINSTLSILEIKDLIKNDFGNYCIF